jgi:hypothetical protein
MAEPNTPNILINCAPVLTLWAATVPELLEFEWDEGLSLGKAGAGLTAQSKGRRALCIVASRAATVYGILDVAHPEVPSFE